MDFKVRFSQDKNQILKSTSGISFEEVEEYILKGNILDNKIHHKKNRSNQRIYVVKIKNYIYLVPYVIDEKKKEIFLKTTYPSRKYAKFYLKGERDDHN